MKVKLDQTYIFKGKIYGPGEVEVPDDYPISNPQPQTSTKKSEGK